MFQDRKNLSLAATGVAAATLLGVAGFLQQGSADSTTSSASPDLPGQGHKALFDSSNSLSETLLPDNPEFRRRSEIIDSITATPTLSLHGQVLTSSGIPAPEGTRVILSAMGIIDPALRNKIPKDPIIVNSNGQFELTGLDPDVSYTIRAGGFGEITPKWQAVTASDFQNGLTLQMDPVIGASFRLLNPRGEPATLTETSDFGRFWRVSLDGKERLPMLAKQDRELLQIPMEFEEGVITFATLAKTTSGLAESAKLSCKFPGYEQQVVDIHLSSFATPATPRNIILDQICYGFGNVEIELTLPSHISSAAYNSNELKPHLILRSDEFRETLEYTLSESLSGTTNFSFHNIPAGSYAVGFASMGYEGFFSDLYLESPVQIGNGTNTSVRLDIQNYGGLTILPPGQLYENEAVTSGWLKAKSSSTAMPFELSFLTGQDPKVFPLLPAGEYSISWSLSSGRRVEQPITVLPNKITDHSIHH